MNNFIEAMIIRYDKTDYRWVSGKCAEFCSHCDFLNNSIKPMYVWLAEGLPGTNGNTGYHNCGDDCSCRLEKV